MIIKKILLGLSVCVVVIAVFLFFPPVRDWFFGNKMFPFKTPWDVTETQINVLTKLARPGDVIVERNLHSWQWMLLSKFATGSSWVHSAMVIDKGKFVTMDKSINIEDFSAYLRKQSTELVLLRPPYKNEELAKKAIEYACSKVGTPFDPKFENQSGNCTGLSATALGQAGIEVKTKKAFGFAHPIYPAVEFFKIKGASIIWKSNDNSDRSEFAQYNPNLPL